MVEHKNEYTTVLYILIVLAALAVAAIAQEKNAVVRLDPTLDAIVALDSRVEKIADGFKFTEGPVWVRSGGYLVFSDIPGNRIYRWNPKDGTTSVLLEHAGFTGTDATGIGKEQSNGFETVLLIGSNGITVDLQDRLVYVAMGDRKIVRLEKDGSRTVLASQYQGKRLNSGNDLVYKSDGSLYFTDPPSGLRGGDDDPKKELPFNGVFLLKQGNLVLLDQSMTNPNGLAFSPDEKTLYVNNTRRRTIIRFDVRPDDTVANGRVFIDMTPETAKGPGNPDGMKVDEKGNVYCSGPGGIWIIAPDGKHLGTILTPEIVANLTFGEADGKTLFITARRGIYRIRVNIPGIRP